MSHRTAALVGLLLVAAATTPRAHSVVEIRLNGHYFIAPANVQFVVAVEPDSTNRVLRLIADGEQMYRSTDVPLSVDDARLHRIEFKNLPAGTYNVTAQVLSSSEIRGVTSDELIIKGR
jgi:hypothetical protein